MLGGSGEGDSHTLGQMNMMSAILTPQLNPANISGEIQTSSTSMSTKKDERIPQWSHQETREFISIRAELERDFTVAKRNKTLWQVVSTKMKERGYRRSPDQCKCKWKNLVNRYKGKETSDPENGRQCPFFDELHAVFTERAKNMQRMLQEQPEAVGAAQAKKKLKGPSVGDRSSDDFSEDEEDVGDESDEERMLPRSNRKRKPEQQQQRQQQQQRSNTTALRTAASGNSSGLLLETLQEFLQQQQRNEMQWREMMERRAQERRLFEEEWRRSMEKLERQRLLVEQAWREREEQRKMREESRAEKRDALLTSLLNKLIQEDRF